MVGREAKCQGYHVSTEDTELGGSADEHELGIGDKRREVGHGTDTEENQRRIPAGGDAIVKDIEHRPFFIDTDFEAGLCVEGDITDKDTKADRHQQHGLEVLLDGKPDEEQTHEQHYEVAELGVGKAGEFPELHQIC